MNRTKTTGSSHLKMPRIPGAASLLALSFLTGGAEGAELSLPPRPQGSSLNEAESSAALERAVAPVKVQNISVITFVSELAKSARINILLDCNGLELDPNTTVSRGEDGGRTLLTAIKGALSPLSKQPLVVEQIGDLVVVSNRSQKDLYYSLVVPLNIQASDKPVRIGPRDTHLGNALLKISEDALTVDWNASVRAGLLPQSRCCLVGELPLPRASAAAALIMSALPANSVDPGLRVLAAKGRIIIGDKDYIGKLAAVLETRNKRNAGQGGSLPAEMRGNGKVAGRRYFKPSFKSAVDELANECGLTVVADWKDLKAKGIGERVLGFYVTPRPPLDLLDYFCDRAGTEKWALDYTIKDKTLTFVSVRMPDAPAGRPTMPLPTPARRTTADLDSPIEISSSAPADKTMPVIAQAARTGIFLDYLGLGIAPDTQITFSNKPRTVLSAINDGLSSVSQRKLCVENLGELIIVSDRSWKAEFSSLLHPCSSQNTKRVVAGQSLPRELGAALTNLSEGAVAVDWEALAASGLTPKSNSRIYGQHPVSQTDAIFGVIASALRTGSKPSFRIAATGGMVVIGEPVAVDRIIARQEARHQRNAAAGGVLDKFLVENTKGHGYTRNNFLVGADLAQAFDNVALECGLTLAVNRKEFEKSVGAVVFPDAVSPRTAQDQLDYLVALASINAKEKDIHVDYTVAKGTLNVFLVKADQAPISPKPTVLPTAAPDPKMETGKTTPKPAVVSEKPAPATTGPKSAARKQLDRADLFMKNNRPDLAQPCLKAIVENFPDAPEAKEAQELLKNMKAE